MTTILRIDASARKADSVTRTLTDRIIARFPDARVVTRDLGTDLPGIDADWVAANFTPDTARSPAQRTALALSDSLIEELRAADTVVIGLPVYNFGVPASFKAWVDQIARAGVTFRYTADGPQGLLDGKRAIVAYASGGVPMGSGADFASGYVRHVLGFIGITDIAFIAAEGVAQDADGAINAATAEIARLAA